MTSLDPYADLAYRIVVAPAIPYIERSLTPAVLNTRCAGTGTAWKATSWKSQHKTYRARLEELRTNGEFEAEAHLDVAGHYGSVQLATLGHLLHSTGMPDHDVDLIMSSLTDLMDVPGQPRGLAMGPEATAPLGTVALLGVDRCLQRHGVENIRWMDDYTLFLDDVSGFDEMVDTVSHQLAIGGQELNPAKTELMEIGLGVEVELSGFGSGGIPGRDPAGLLAERAWTGDPRNVPFALGGLRVRQNASGIAILKSNPWILARFPRQCASYLMAVSDDVESWDFVAEIVLEPINDDNAGAHLWLPRALPMNKLGKDLGTELFALGATTDRVRHGAIANELLAAGGRSCEPKRSRQRRAIELAETVSDLNAKRAALSAFSDRHLSRQARKGLRHLQRVDPDLEATVRWAGLAAAA